MINQRSIFESDFIGKCKCHFFTKETNEDFNPVRAIDLALDQLVPSRLGFAHVPVLLRSGARSGRLKTEADILVGTVGAITDAFQAEHILRTGQADGVFIARAALADPRWCHCAAHRLGYELPWVPQYRWPQPQKTY